MKKGDTFERLTAIRQIKRDQWLFKCKCGVERKFWSSNVTSGRARSCGCLNREKMTTHGLSHSPEYSSWNNMVQRCTNKNLPSYKDYGGRGIKLCRRWGLSFKDFFSDMGPKPTKKHSIHRVNNNGHYEPGNCIWATQKTQANSMRSNNVLIFNGQAKTATQWAEAIGMSLKCLDSRLRSGWDIGRALQTPAKIYRRTKA